MTTGGMIFERLSTSSDQASDDVDSNAGGFFGTKQSKMNLLKKVAEE